MHKDILVELESSIDSYALKALANSLYDFCKDNNITLEGAVKIYIDLHPQLTRR